VKASQLLLACRSGQPDARIESVRLDLADLSSIAECYKSLSSQPDKLAFDVVLNNAGVMATPKMQTKDGFEYQVHLACKGVWTLTPLAQLLLDTATSQQLLE